jgi:serine protease Do
MKRTLLNLTYIGVGVAVAVLAFQFIPSYAKEDRTPPKIIVDARPVERNGKFTTSFAPVIKKAAPSVVNIYSTKIIKPRDLRNNPFLDPLFRQFFGDRGEQMPRRSTREQSLGSGVIVSPDGYILTSNHVVEGADEIKIVLASGHEYTAKVIGTDPPTDTAVLKVDAKDLPAITLADSDKLEVGDIVLAIGNPFGIGQTVTMGIVSATGRGELGIVDYENFIQTDASINPGNSGGALVDAEGRLVGINTAILSRTGGNQGVGFAIPVSLSRVIMERLIVDGKVTRGFLGVGLQQQLTPDLAERFGIEDQGGGALVTAVEDNTPASEAGFKPGDIIVGYNGKKITDSRQLRLMVSQTRPKTKVSFKVLRDGKSKTFNVTLAELPNERTMSEMLQRGAPDESENETLDGVEVGDLDARTRRQNGIPSHIRGALITNVDPDSPAYEAGLRPGDVILEMEKKPITSAEEAVDISNNFKGDNILLRVWRQGSATYIPVPVERKSKSKGDDEEKDQQDQDQNQDSGR